jgi:hypothetical protein
MVIGVSAFSVFFRFLAFFCFSAASVGGQPFSDPGPKCDLSFLVAFLSFLSLHKLKKAECQSTDGQGNRIV